MNEGRKRKAWTQDEDTDDEDADDEDAGPSTTSVRVKQPLDLLVFRG